MRLRYTGDSSNDYYDCFHLTQLFCWVNRSGRLLVSNFIIHPLINAIMKFDDFYIYRCKRNHLASLKIITSLVLL